MTEKLLAVGLLVMMYPILCKVRYESLHHLFKHRALWIQIGFSIVMNWIVAPFLMVSTERCMYEESLTDHISSPWLGRSSQTAVICAKA